MNYGNEQMTDRDGANAHEVLSTLFGSINTKRADLDIPEQSNHAARGEGASMSIAPFQPARYSGLRPLSCSLSFNVRHRHPLFPFQSQ